MFSSGIRTSEFLERNPQIHQEGTESWNCKLQEFLQRLLRESVSSFLDQQVEYKYKLNLPNPNVSLGVCINKSTYV